MKLIRGGRDDDREISQGQNFGCECTGLGHSCPCNRVGTWVPAGQPVPSVVTCNKCQRGDHSG